MTSTRRRRGKVVYLREVVGGLENIVIAARTVRWY
jgi:hypothetical protein